MVGLTMGILENSVTGITYATWDPLHKGVSVVLSGGNLTISDSGGNACAVATIGKSSGKWYWEITILSGADSRAHGIADDITSTVTSGNMASNTHSWAYISFLGAGYSWTNGGGSNNANPYTIGDVIGFALDMGAGTLKFYKNNVLQVSAGFTGLTGTIYPASGTYSNNAFSAVANFGATTMAYTAPAGYNQGVF